VRIEGLLVSIRSAMSEGDYDHTTHLCGELLEVDPEHPEGLALLERARVAGQAADWIQQARDCVARQDFSEADVLLRQALGLDDLPSDQISSIREFRVAVDQAARRARVLEETIRDIRGNIDAGQLPRALDGIERALALAPGNLEAIGLKRLVARHLSQHAAKEEQAAATPLPAAGRRPEPTLDYVPPPSAVSSADGLFAVDRLIERKQWPVRVAIVAAIGAVLFGAVVLFRPARPTVPEPHDSNNPIVDPKPVPPPVAPTNPEPVQAARPAVDEAWVARTLAQAQNASDQGDYHAATRMFNAILAQAPNRADARQGLKVAEDRQAAEQKPHLARAQDDYTKGQYDDAIQEYNKVLAIGPSADATKGIDTANKAKAAELKLRIKRFEAHDGDR
jgi:tetratricopeptide (TPR) repeat protein